MFVCVLTAVLHYLKCLALRWPTQTQTVLRFSQVLVCHLRTLHLSIFFLTWLKGNKKEEIWQRTSVISGSSCLHKVLSTIWENLLKTVVLLETCWLSCWRYAARNSPLCQLSLFFCCAFSPTHTHIQYIQPSSASLVGNKSVLHTIKWRNECVGSSSFLSRCLWFFSSSAVFSAASLENDEITATTCGVTFPQIDPAGARISQTSVHPRPPSCSQTTTF